MKYTVLNKLYWSALGRGAEDHYHRAMRSRGWLPDFGLERDRQLAEHERREALEDRGPRNEDPAKTANQSPYRERKSTRDPLGADANCAQMNRYPGWWYST